MSSTRDETAYALGRLLAILDRLGAVPAVDRLYLLASIDPSHLVQPLTRASEASEANRRALEPLVSALPATAFEATLTIQQQGDFSLGYYHEERGGTARRRRANQRAPPAHLDRHHGPAQSRRAYQPAAFSRPRI